MAVKLRLMRMGKKKQPTYRVVAADSRSPRDGRFIEAVGVYAPRGRSSSDRDAIVQIDDAKVLRWLSQGAKPTDRVERLLTQTGTLERFRTGAVAADIPAGDASEVPDAEAVTTRGAAGAAAGSGQMDAATDAEATGAVTADAGTADAGTDDGAEGAS